MKHLRKEKQIINHFVRKPLKVTSYNKELHALNIPAP